MGQAKIRYLRKQTKPDPTIAFALIGWRSVEIPFMYCRDQLRQHPAVKYEIPGVGDAMVQRARAICATRFLEEPQLADADVLLSIDTDIEFLPQDAIQICEQAMEHSIVAGLYVSRGRGPRCKPTSHWAAGTEVRFGVGKHSDPTPVEILWGAGGFIAIHRRVFERLAQDIPVCHPKDASLRHIPFYDPFPVETTSGIIELSEDYAFCERARRVGFPTYLNPAVRLAHWGVEPHRIEDMFVPEPPLMDVWLTHHENGSYTRVCPDGWWEHALDLRKDDGLKEVASNIPDEEPTAAAGVV